MSHVTQRLVLPSHLNQFGRLFGGQLLAWVDEASWLAASLDYPDCQFVTVGMDEVKFEHGVESGTILSIESKEVKCGKTSVNYAVEVRRGKVNAGELVFTTSITFVNVDAEGEKKAI